MITLGDRKQQPVKYQIYTYTQQLLEDGHPYGMITVTYRSDDKGYSSRVKLIRNGEVVVDTGDMLNMSPEDLVADILNDLNSGGF